MAERTLIVCDVCGRPAVEVVGLRIGGRSLTKDVCAEHLEAMTEGARARRPGRRAGVLAGSEPVAGAKRRGRPPGSKNKATRKPTAKNPTARRRSGRPKSAVKKATRRGRPRKKGASS